MKIRTMFFTCLLGAGVLFLCHEYSSAQSKPLGSASNIGVVDIRKVFRDCKKNAKYRAESLASQSKMKAEQDDLAKSINALEAGLQALKPGSSDYMAQVRELFEKKASLKAMEEFNARQQALRDQQWTEALYKETLEIVGGLAEEKALALVLEADEPEFPVRSAEELMMALQTRKVLYGRGCVDITADVVAKMDSNDAAVK